jgi:hypothetical protein
VPIDYILIYKIPRDLLDCPRFGCCLEYLGAVVALISRTLCSTVIVSSYTNTVADLIVFWVGKVYSRHIF